LLQITLTEIGPFNTNQYQLLPQPSCKTGPGLSSTISDAFAKLHNLMYLWSTCQPDSSTCLSGTI